MELGWVRVDELVILFHVSSIGKFYICNIEFNIMTHVGPKEILLQLMGCLSYTQVPTQWSFMELFQQNGLKWVVRVQPYFAFKK